MMSFYTSRNNRQQFSISNQKKTQPTTVPRCYDNGSYLPDPLPISNITHADYSEDFHHQQNQQHQQITHTKNYVNNNNTGISKTFITNNNNNNNSKSVEITIQQTSSQTSNTTMVSRDKTPFTLNNNLPTIMSDLSLHERKQMTFSSTSSSSDTTQKDSISQQQEQQKLQFQSSSDPKTCLSKEFVSGKMDTEQTHCIVGGEKHDDADDESSHVTTTKDMNDERETSVVHDKCFITNVDCTKRCDIDIDRSCPNITTTTTKVKGQMTQEEERDSFTGNVLQLNKNINVKHKRLHRLKRSATNDESMVKKQQHNSTDRLPRCKSIDSSYVADEQAHFFSEQVKPVKSKRKLLRRSMSVGFSKFKLITSNLSLRSHQKFNDDDVNIDFNEIEHQTSRRKNTSCCATDQLTVEDLLADKNEDIEKFIGGEIAYPPLLRSLSAPDPLDYKEGEEHDEDLSELHLPRRRAICPNLPVPAMKQLKTYLILTRLKQYCFV